MNDNEKTEELSQIGGDEGDMTVKCNVRSWNRKGTLVEKLVSPNKIYSLANPMVPMLTS